MKKTDYYEFDIYISLWYTESVRENLNRGE